jgi:hypothetical protein
VKTVNRLVSCPCQRQCKQKRTARTQAHKFKVNPNLHLRRRRGRRGRAQRRGKRRGRGGGRGRGRAQRSPRGIRSGRRDNKFQIRRPTELQLSRVYRVHQNAHCDTQKGGHIIRYTTHIAEAGDRTNIERSYVLEAERLGSPSAARPHREKDMRHNSQEQKVSRSSTDDSEISL